MTKCPAIVSSNANIAPERRGKRCGKPAGPDGFCWGHGEGRAEISAHSSARQAKRRALREEAALAMVNEALLCDGKRQRTHAMFFRWAAEALRKWRGPSSEQVAHAMAPEAERGRTGCATRR